MQPSPEAAANPEVQQDGIREIHIAGFCSLKEVCLELGRLSLLIGPNGAGMSNLLQALRLIPLLRTRSLQRYVADQGFGAGLLYFGPKTTEAIVLGMVIRDQGTTYRYDARLAFRQVTRCIFRPRTPPDSILTTPGRLAQWAAANANPTFSMRRIRTQSLLQ